jgi:hypothetical protein
MEQHGYHCNGDHGFVDVKNNVSPNLWLMKAGLLTDAKKMIGKHSSLQSAARRWLYLRKNDKKTLNSYITHYLNYRKGRKNCSGF